MSDEGEKRLPSDCWLMIFRLLSGADLKALSSACKAFQANSNSLKKSLKVIDPDISMLSEHLKRFSQLKNINLFHFEGDVAEAIREIRRSTISLESLDVATHNFFKEESVKSLRGWGSNLKALNCRIRNCRLMDVDGDDDVDVDVEVIANAFPDLQELEIEAPRDVLDDPTGFGFESLASKLKRLTKIHLYSCKVSDQFIIALSLNCVLLKDVAIVESNYVSETGVGHLLRNRPNLEALSFTTNNVAFDSSINIENSVSHAKALTSLTLYFMRFTDKVLKAIAKTKLGVNSLRLIDCKDFTASALLLVLSNQQLTMLSLGGPDFTEEDLEEVVLNGNVRNLTHIEIDQCKVKGSTLSLLSTRCPSLVDMRTYEAELYEAVELDIISFPKHHKMTCLHLDCGAINDEFVQQLGFLFPNLKVLHLSTRFEHMHVGIEAIQKSFKHIKELSLCGCLIEANDPELVELNLEVLGLSLSSIDDEALAAIAKKCPRLLSLELRCCRNITTEGVKQVIQNIKTLTSLNLIYRYSSQDYGALLEWMLSTRNLASLNRIFLPKTDFTKEQRNKFLDHGCLLSNVVIYARS